MHNTYGYIRGTEGVDGDHIDVFFSDDPSQGDVFVVDQVNKDGSFDEHKVMYGFPDIESARKAYLSNYEDGWTGLGAITPVSKEEFKKWVESSHRKTKPFADYKNVKKLTEDVDQRPTNVNAEGLVVDEKGKPLTLYHGTPNDVEFGSLEIGHVRDGEEVPARFNGNGISFTPDRTVATEYATSEGGKGKVFEVNVTLKKPYFTLGVANFSPEEAAAFTEGLIANGYDGIINYSSKWMRDAGALPSEVIVFDMNDVKPLGDAQLGKHPTAGYSIEPTTYTNKKGKTTPMHLVTFDRELSKDEIRAGKELAKESRGWWDREKGGFMMRNEKSAKALAEALSNEEAVQDAQPLTLEDMKHATAEPVAEDEGGFHGGDTVWSKKHGENKHILMAHRMEIDGRSFVQRYTFTDGTGATAQEVEAAHEEGRDPRWREGWNGDYTKWKARQDYLDEIERKEQAAADEGRVAYYVAGSDSYGQRNGTFHKVWLMPEDVVTEDGVPRYRGRILYTQQEAWHSEEGFQLGKIYYTGEEFAKAWGLKEENNVDKPAYAGTEQVTEQAPVEDEGTRAMQLFESINEGDVFVNDHGLKVEIIKKVDGKRKAISNAALGFKWTQDNGKQERQIYNALHFMQYLEANNLKPAADATGTVADEKKVSSNKIVTSEQEQPKQEEKKAKSKWVNDEDADRFEELRARLKQKLRGQMNMGVDPEIFAIGVEMSYLMLKKGARRFNEFAKNLIEALGDEVRPYIKAFYNGARDLPEMADLEKDMTTWDEVRSFDVM
ncbi:MAG: hypothetical protein SOY69_01300, partial [Alloprevotella sp.]|nr:hypothetical protein [Alloprevotella sp.]